MSASLGGTLSGDRELKRDRLTPWISSIGVLIFFVFTMTNLAFGSVIADDPPSSPWKLVWSDDFDYNGTPDPNKWAFETGGGGWGNSEKEFYTDHLDNCRVENGHLVIEAKREDYQGEQYTSARLHSLGDGWKFGRIDVKARLPGGVGTWPAIWMLPTHPQYGNLGWPDNGEIDIMEYAAHDPGQVLGSMYSKNHIWWDNTGLSIYQSVPDAETAYHIYSVQWSQTTVDLMVDGVTYNSFPNPQSSWEDWPFDQQYRIIMNVALGGWGGDDVDDAALPQSMSVDYVHVYELQQPPAMTVADW